MKVSLFFGLENAIGAPQKTQSFTFLATTAASASKRLHPYASVSIAAPLGSPKGRCCPSGHC